MDNQALSSGKPDRSISKSNNFANKVLIVNGWEGSGKTGISNVLKSIDGIENMKYSLEFEIISHLWLSNNLDSESASVSISTFADYIIYNLIQSREINIRFADLSSIFRSPIWYKYIFRLFSKGGEDSSNLITDKTILNLVTHNLYQCYELIHQTFGSRLIFLEVIRDPLFMLSQMKYNQKFLYNNKSTARNFTLNYKRTDNPIVDGPNAFDQDKTSNWVLAMNFLERRMKQYFEQPSFDSEQQNKSPFFIFFEDFVKEPFPVIKEIETLFDLRFNPKLLSKYLKHEKIPRKDHSDGRNTSIYKKVGWKNLHLNKENKSEDESYVSHYKSLGVPSSIIKRLVDLSNTYRSWKENFYTNN